MLNHFEAGASVIECFSDSLPATQTSGKKAAACSRARIAASILSVFMQSHTHQEFIRFLNVGKSQVSAN
jgi:hypothetical protein